MDSANEFFNDDGKMFGHVHGVPGFHGENTTNYHSPIRRDLTLRIARILELATSQVVRQPTLTKATLKVSLAC